MGVLLAGCGSSAASAKKSTPAPTATHLVLPTFTPTVQGSATPDTQATVFTRICGTDNFPNLSSVSTLGDFLASQPALNGLDYPGANLPEGIPLKPFKMPGESQQNWLNQSSGNVLANPGNGDYLFNVCNLAQSQGHTITGVTVKVTGFTPYNGHLNEWVGCDGAYSRQSPGAGGCGGGDQCVDVCLRLNATLPAGAKVGDSFTISEGEIDTGSISQGQITTNSGPISVTLSHASGVRIDTSIIPTTSGIYTFQFALKLSDGSTTDFIGVPTTQVLFAPIAQKWSGFACSASQMQSQIPPATNPETFFVCPVSGNQ